MLIGGGSPCVEALPFGASTSDINVSIQEQVPVLVVTITQLVYTAALRIIVAFLILVVWDYLNSMDQL